MDGLACPDRAFRTQPTDADFHPTENIVVVSCVDGSVHVQGYGSKMSKSVDISVHTGPARFTRFFSGGDMIVTGGADHSLVAATLDGSVVWREPSAHASGLNVAICDGDSTLVSGDEDGVVKVWDLRSSRSVAEISCGEDFISDFDMEGNGLVASCADGTLSAIDSRRWALVGQSIGIDDELLSVSVVKKGKVAAAGTQSGMLMLYEMGSDAPPEPFRGHPESVDAMLSVDDSLIVTGSSDGLIRVVQIRPNSLLGLVGEHGDMPIECLRWSGDRRILASLSHDCTLRFWDVGYFYDDDDDEDAGGDSESAGPRMRPIDKASSKNKTKKKKKKRRDSSFFDGML